MRENLRQIYIYAQEMLKRKGKTVSSGSADIMRRGY